MISDAQILRAAQRKHRRNCEAIAEQCTRLLRSDPGNAAADDWRLGIARRNEEWDDVPEHLREMMIKEIREIVEDAVSA